MTYPVKEIKYGSYDWLRREVGAYLYGQHNFDALDAESQRKVDSIIESGLMQFYYPPPLPSEEPQPPHQWSFLTPATELETVNGQRAYELPEDFSGILGEFTVG